MVPVLFLDEASRHAGSMDRTAAMSVAHSFLEVLKGLRRINKKFALNTARPISQYQVSDEWTLQSLLGGVEFKEEWAFIRGLSIQSPLSAGLDHLSSEINGMEFRTRASGVQSVSLAWATILETAVISFNQHPDWFDPWVETSYLELDDNGNIQSSNGCVRNNSKIDHVSIHAEWLRNLELSPSPSGSELWAERDERFPTLRFLPRVEKDILKLSICGAPFRQALAALNKLEEDARNWPEAAPRPNFSIRATPEHETRKQLCRTYDHETGEEELFDWHVRFTGGVAGRVHFRIEGSTRRLVVAYIGAKLTTNIVG